MVDPIQFHDVAGSAAPPSVPNVAKPLATPFSQVLENEVLSARGVRFSAHALERLDSRRITLSAADQARIRRAVEQAASRGARETLLLMDRLALIVSVPNRTVITVVPYDQLEHNVFTNIDSAVVVADTASAPSQE